ARRRHRDRGPADLRYRRHRRAGPVRGRLRAAGPGRDREPGRPRRPGRLPAGGRAAVPAGRARRRLRRVHAGRRGRRPGVAGRRGRPPGPVRAAGRRRARDQAGVRPVARAAVRLRPQRGGARRPAPGPARPGRDQPVVGARAALRGRAPAGASGRLDGADRGRPLDPAAGRPGADRRVGPAHRRRPRLDAARAGRGGGPAVAAGDARGGHGEPDRAPGHRAGGRGPAGAHPARAIAGPAPARLGGAAGRRRPRLRRRRLGRCPARPPARPPPPQDHLTSGASVGPVTSLWSDLGRPPLSERALRAALVRPGGFVREVHVVAETGSTNADLAEVARRGGPEGVVLVAEAQTRGRGRLDRTWTSPPRAGLLFSVLLRPPGPPPRRTWIPLLAGLAVQEAVARLGAVETRLKWPNDLLLGDDLGKAGGILAQATGDAVVVGVGLNVTTRRAELPEGAVSLLTEGAGR